ncbi:hypothetical protein SAMN05216474_3043 [Lishizhenia tianjinensis]|uniref:Uncharacterized protein n=1 Tax=Lishizhenia tianjinensis TaxID=477690 RepID=A0A1I7BSD3_9FLAO|nr:hypothetical protein [Lishizhenia tianjinensis]SFT90001.1 hypothetical protein SAMN05216474_3043 [Lishizhenia tianjinensis]
MDKSKAREASNAIGRIYITMRHLMNRGFYKPMGVSGKTLREALLELQPEIYGAIAEDKLEINGLFYVLDRLPEGIENCKYIHLTSDEGYKDTHIPVIIPPKRRRKCYPLDKEQINIEITRGRSDVYDILTHLTFLFIESHKIAHHILREDEKDTIREWQKLEEALQKSELSNEEIELALIHTSTIIGRSFTETKEVYTQFASEQHPHRFLKLIYGLGKLALDEIQNKDKRVITFSKTLRERIGHHIYGDIWATQLKHKLQELHLMDRPLHIISANMHSVMNYLYARQAMQTEDAMACFENLSQSENKEDRKKVMRYAKKHGLHFIKDDTGTNIDVQIIDLAKLNLSESFLNNAKDNRAVLLVMDYAFGEQAYESMDELLKPLKLSTGDIKLHVESISIMGKAGILEGDKGDIMLPTAHVFEGTADNYPFLNELHLSDFQHEDLKVQSGPMITVLGTSLQNKDVLEYFKTSTWGMIGLEMEGAHYQKAIQSASRIRKSVREDVKVRYAYYASDNPLKTGSTLASGGLGLTGVKPTYIITKKILQQILH